MIAVVGTQRCAGSTWCQPLAQRCATGGTGLRSNFLIQALSLAHAGLRLLRDTGHTKTCASAVDAEERGTTMQDQIPLSGWEVRGDLACLLCARTVASA